MGLMQAINLLIQRPRSYTGTVTGNYFAGTATSGLPGQDLFTFGLPNQWWRLQEGYFRLFPGVWNIAAHVSCRVYFTMFGSMTLIDTSTYDADGTDGDIVFVYWFWGNYEMYGPLRVELQSDNAGDVAVAVPYEFRIKDW
jgi:hypothetical protein